MRSGSLHNALSACFLYDLTNLKLADCFGNAQGLHFATHRDLLCNRSSQQEADFEIAVQ